MIENINEYKVFIYSKRLALLEGEFTIPEEVTSIGRGAFVGCKKLTKINIPDSVTSIDEGAFERCESLTEINIPEKVTLICNETFRGCKGLTKINIPKGVTSIGEGAFAGCESLVEINIPESVTSIEGGAFVGCKKLTKINIPEGVVSIGNFAFQRCESLTEIDIPDSATLIGNDTFSQNYNFNSLRYDEENKKFVYGYSEKLAKNNKYIPMVYFIELGTEKLKALLKNWDFNAFNSNIPNLANFLKDQPKEEQLDFFKFAVAIGCFSTEKILDKNNQETEVTVGQRASTILARLLKTDILRLGQYHAFFDSLQYDEKVSLEFLEFIFPQGKKNDNLELLSRMECSLPGVFQKTMLNFEKIKKQRITSKNGRNIVLPWEKVIEKFYFQSQLLNTTDENEDIAEEYFSKGLDGYDYQKGVELRNQAKQNGVPEHILGKPIREKTIIEQIEDLKRKTEEELNSTIEIIDELYKKIFTYEWLSKNDPKNGILGLYVSCCGHIKSMYYGKNIAISSIIQKDVQNLVIHDTKGEIISKGTIYVNEENGYAVFNDFELNQKYRDHEQESGRYSVDSKPDEELTESERKQKMERDLIFEAFQRGIMAFVEEYDRQHPNNPIKQINVGMGFNRLKRNIEQFEKATELLEVPIEYGFNDASTVQYVLYKKAEIDRKSKTVEER